MSLKTSLTGWRTYRGGEGQWAFLLHRLSGLGTGLFLTLHILDLALFRLAPRLFQRLLLLYQSPLFGLAEIVLVFLVFFHSINGLRMAYFDLQAPHLWNPETARKSARLTLLIAAGLWLPAAAWMLRSLLLHSPGLGG